MTKGELDQLMEPSEQKLSTNIKISGHSAILVYDLESHRDEFEMAQNASNMAAALFDIQQEVWRPAYKHGYSDKNISDLVEKINSVLEKSDLVDAAGDKIDAESLISALSTKYHDILEEHGVSRFANY